MSDTPNIGFPLLDQAQAQKEVTVNESLVILDVLLGGVISRTETAPPGSPAAGDGYIVDSPATGVWAGHEDDIAYYFGSVWNFLPPEVGAGHQVWVEDESLFVQYGAGSPSGWEPAGGGDASSVSYTPAVPADWDGGVDPGEANDALDQLAERVKDIEGGGAGTELKGLTFTSDTGSTADSDPGAGLFKWNNATQASATFLYFDNATLDAVTISTFWASLGAIGYIYLQQADDSTKWQLWKWTSTPTNGTGYYKFAVTLQANGGSIADDKTVYCDFKPDATGASGTTGRHAIWIAAGSITPSATGGCAALATIASAANQPDIQTLDFDATTQEYAQFSIRMPKSWNEGTVTFVPEWSHAATTTVGTVRVVSTMDVTTMCGMNGCVEV